MSLLDYFRPPKKTSANLAKERLKIVLSHERSDNNKADFLPQLQQELIAVIAKYVEIDQDQVKVELDKRDDRSVLELNITLPEGQQAETEAA